MQRQISRQSLDRHVLLIAELLACESASLKFRDQLIRFGPASMPLSSSSCLLLRRPLSSARVRLRQQMGCSDAYVAIVCGDILRTPLSGAVQLRVTQFTPVHSAGLLALSQSIGWQQTLEDWHRIFEAGMVFGHRSTEGEVVSSTALFVYGRALASIGMVIVRKDLRRQGLARAVIQHCLADLPNPETPTMLVARPDGQRLYGQLGFREVEPVHRLISRQRPDAHARCDISPLAVNDFTAIHQLDTEVYGANRETALKARIAQSDGGAVLRGGQARGVTGFALMTHQHDLLMVGPVIAPEFEAAVALIATLVAGYNRPVQIDIPDRQRQLLDVLRREGFQHDCTCPLMLLHAQNLPGRREQLFALSNRSLG